MTASAQPLHPTPRVATGVTGLDTILHGGFLQGGIYLLRAPSGGGKTVLGNQLCSNHVAAGGRAVYVELLSETHTQMFAHLQSMTFFTMEPINRTLHYYSGYGVLEKAGTTGLLELLRQVIHDRQPTLMVIDGLGTVEELVEEPLDLKQFFSDLHAFMQAAGCTGFLLTQPSFDHNTNPIYTVLDGVVSLDMRLIGSRLVREIQILKLRGSAFIEGLHTYQITDEGLVVYPRIEALPPSPPTEPDPQHRMSFGIVELDKMLQGGIPASSLTLAVGAAGTGKTLLGVHFLAQGAREGQPGLYFGFYEPPPALLVSASQIGLDLRRFVAEGLIETVWQPPLENVLDVLVVRLFEAVRRRKVERVFIDGLNGLLAGIAYPERLDRVLVGIATELRARGVTAYMTSERGDVIGPIVALPENGSASIVDNVILLRHVELRSQLYRLISILKMRSSGYDAAIREFEITGQGIRVSRTFESAEAILTGIARPIAQTPPATDEGSG
jgi:circadian clock protein KaiC